MTETPEVGLLRVVATPLGNLEDISDRARRALREADCVAAEDTRRTGLLLAKLGIPKKPMVAIFATKEAERTPKILDRVRQGQTVVLVTDGGSPGISDPGARLIEAAYRSGVRVEVVPGPSAVTMALSVSSMGGGAFVFEGFLPTTQAKRRDQLARLALDPRPFIIFEAPHRIRECLEDIVFVAGSDRRITMVREGTKLYEEIRETSAGTLLESLPGKPLGEFTLVVAGATVSPEHVTVDPLELLRFAMEFGLSPESAARRVAEAFGVPRSRLLRRSKENPAEES